MLDVTAELEPPEVGGDIVDQQEQADVVLGLIELQAQINLYNWIDDDAKLSEIAKQVVDECAIDEASRADWMKKAEESIELASMITEEKSKPWRGAPNVKYPLVIEACLQFWSGTFPAIMPAGDIVRCPVHGQDKSGRKQKRADRVSSYTSFYLRNRTPEWGDDTSRLMMQLPAVGHLFRKWWRNPAEGRAESRLCAADAVIVNQATSHLEKAPRITEKVSLYPNEIKERERDGRFRRFDYSSYTGKRDGEELHVGDMSETNDDTLAPQMFLEQHRWLDLDDDGYMEPYIVTVHEESQEVVRIVANWTPEDVKVEIGGEVVTLAMAYQLRMRGLTAPATVRSMKRREFFTDYRLLPSLDGTYYGIGFGYLLNHTNRSINTIINMLLAAGQLSTLGGGFIGQGPNLKGSKIEFQPGRWITVNTMGATLREAIVEAPFREPSPVMFSLLGFLVEAGQRVGQTRDLLNSENLGANASPTTVMALIQKGEQVHSAVVMDLFRSLGREYKLVAKILHLYPDEENYREFHDEEPDPQQMVAGGMPQQDQVSMREDFSAAHMDIEPVADPREVSDAVAMSKAQLLLEMSRGGDVQRDPVTAKRVMQAANISDLEEFFPELTPEQQEAQAAAQKKAAELQERAAVAEISEKEATTRQKLADAQEKMAQVEKIYEELRRPSPQDVRDNGDAIRVMVERDKASRAREKDAADAMLRRRDQDIRREVALADVGRKERADIRKILAGPNDSNG
ncbi:MAG: hypothetical protein AAFU68_02760 [Pseudomonadota bacterium]